MKIPKTVAAAALEQDSKSNAFEGAGTAAELDMVSNIDAGETKSSQTDLLSTMSRTEDGDKAGEGKECESGSDSDSDTDSDDEHEDLSEKLSKIIGETSQEDLQDKNPEPISKGEDKLNELDVEECKGNLKGE